VVRLVWCGILMQGEALLIYAYVGMIIKKAFINHILVKFFLLNFGVFFVECIRCEEWLP
jgi:hypothetical protein